MWESNASPATVATRFVKQVLFHVSYKITCNPRSPHTAANLAAPPARAQVHLCLAIKAITGVSHHRKDTQTRENGNSNRATWRGHVNHPGCGHVPESSYQLSHSANRTPAAWHHWQGPGASRKAARMLPAGSWEPWGKRTHLLLWQVQPEPHAGPTTRGF